MKSDASKRITVGTQKKKRQISPLKKKFFIFLYV